ncbi:Integrase catalytic core [Arabidopsis suecica]|uniref:Integrase catalytic core n=1 Tax=Arabidopsis suecica TaxID=45249 RepID=A0A8T1ZDL7_ARASU|nr:Integrase catalytic core [Arabidopsis suecica]
MALVVQDVSKAYKDLKFPVVLNGNNYLLWKRTTMNVLGGRGLTKHIESTYEEAKALEESLVKETWTQEDLTVLSALHCSLEASLLEGYSYCETSKELWDTLANVFGNESNLTRVYELKKTLGSLSQEDNDFNTHFGKYRSLVAELEMLRPFTTEATTLKDRREQDRVFGLLMTLNPTYTDVIQHILRDDKIPTLEQVCAKIQKEFGSQGLFGVKGENLPTANKAGFVKHKDKKALVCEHCNKKGHAKEDCWILHPHLKPEKFKNLKPKANVVNASNGGQENEERAIVQYGQQEKALQATIQDKGCGSSSQNQETIVMNKADLESLIQSIASKFSTGGISLFTSNSYDPKSLVLDSGASHHMISNPKLLENIKPALGSVKVANGHNVPIEGIGSINLFSKRSSAFYMPKFTSNLLSVKKTTRDLNCLAIFSPNDVKLQDIKSGNVFGQGDEKSKYTWVTLLPSKDRVYDAFINFQNYVTNHFDAKIKILRTDNGGEYTSTKLKTHLEKCGILHQTSCPYNPQQNGVAERKNRHLMEVARAMLFEKHMPKRFWGDAVLTSCYLINRIPTRDLRNKLEPKSTKCVFIGYSTTQKGYKCYDPVMNRYYVSRDVKFMEDEAYFGEKNWEGVKDLPNSTSDRAKSLRHILEHLSNGCSRQEGREAIPNDGIIEAQEGGKDIAQEKGNDISQVASDNQQGISREERSSEEVVEENPSSEGEVIESSSDDEIYQAPQTTQDPIYTRENPRRSKREKKSPSNWKNTRVYYNCQAVAHPIQATCSIDLLPKEHKAFISKLDVEFVPQRYEEAKGIKEWDNAVDDEVQAMLRNHTWDEEELPQGKKCVSSKWVFTIKYKSNGDIERYKARLVARGFTQTYGDDYRETFAPVAKQHTVKVVLSLAVNLDWELWQMDVKNAFLQGELEEEVYMTPPPGLENLVASGKVLRLRKAIYGLKQSPRAWYHKLSSTLKANGFKKSESDHTLFTLQNDQGIVVVLIYVDDLIISGRFTLGKHHHGDTLWVFSGILKKVPSHLWRGFEGGSAQSCALHCSLDTSILEGYSYCETAKELWDTLTSVFGNETNLTRVYGIKKALGSLNQEESDFNTHFGKYRSLVAELEMLRPFTTDAKVLRERREQDRVFGLLLSLNSSYTDVIQHILRDEKTPTLEQVCAKIQKEYSSQMLFGTKGVSLPTANKVGMVKQEDKKTWSCDHCKRKGHLKDKCWLLHPHLKPEKFKNYKPKANVANGGDGGSENEERAIVQYGQQEKAMQAVIHNQGGASTSQAQETIVMNKADLESLLQSIASKLHPSGNVKVANGHNVPIEGIGCINLFNKRSSAFYMPKFTSNLLSVKKTTKDLNCLAIFSPNDVKLQGIENGKVFGQGSTKDDLYVLEDLSLNSVLNNNVSSSIFANSVKTSVVLWHERLGHPHSRALNLLLPGFSYDCSNCEACILGKHCKVVFPKSNTIYEKCFDLVHSDVWTSPCASRDNHKYFVTFIDEKSKYTWITLLPSKDRVYDAFLNFQNYVTNHFDAKIKILRTDNGGEYTSTKFKEHLEKCGILHQTSCPYNPQQNGVAERKNRHLMEVSRAMLFQKHMPKRFWGDAVMTACYLINRTPTRDLRNKLEPKSTKCVFIGYSTTQKGYKCFDPVNNRYHVSRDVKFMEDKAYFGEKSWESVKDLPNSTIDRAKSLRHILEHLGNVSPSQEDAKATPNVDTNEAQAQESGGNATQEPLDIEQESGGEKLLGREEEPSEEVVEKDPSSEGEVGELSSEDETYQAPQVPQDSVYTRENPRRSTREKKSLSNWKNTRVYYNCQAVAHPIQATCSIDLLPEEHKAFLSKLDVEFIPQNYEEAKERKEWTNAVDDEVQAMIRNHTWDEEELPKGKKCVSSKWVFTIKYKSDGEIERYKARLVARGFTQTYGDDYRETFAPVAKQHTVKVVLSLAVNLDWELWQMDVKNAFLQGELEEESPRAWYHKLSSTLLANGFKKSHSDHTLFTKQDNQGIVVVLVYVDDLIISGSNKEGIQAIKSSLHSAFDIKDLGVLKYFLGIEVCRSKEGLFLSQRKYALDLLKLTGKLGAKPVDTPLEQGYKVNRKGEKDDTPYHCPEQYRRLVGKLIYLTYTRPDLSFAVNQVAQHMQTPTVYHWGLVERILRYIKGSPGKGIWMGRNSSTEIVGYCDADYNGDRNTRQSTTGFCTFIGGNLALLKDFGIEQKTPITFHCDNQAAIHIATNPVFHERTKHIETDCHKTREKIEDGIEVCRSPEGLFLSQRKYTLDLLKLTGKLGAKPVSTPLEPGYKVNRKGEKDDRPYHCSEQYRRLVGKLIYLTYTRPDISFAVNQVSQHMKEPTVYHWSMVDRILKYLKGSPGQGIWMGKNSSTEIVGYCDADYGGDRNDRHSTTGFCTFIGGNLVTWKSKKQKVVSCSSAEAEYRAMKKLTNELTWLKALLKDFGIEQKTPITFHCDNQAAIHIANNPVFHERTKHVEIDCHKTREKIEDGTILPCYTESSDQLADIFTKAASTQVCKFIHGKLGLVDLTHP